MTDTILQYPPDIGQPENSPAWAHFTFFEWGRSGLAKEGMAPGAQVGLYMPERVKSPGTTRWDAEQLGFVGAKAVDAERGILNTMTGQQDNTNFFSQITSKISDIASQGLQVGAAHIGADLLADTVNLFGGKASAEGILGAAAGRTFNPYLTMLFKSVDFRTFSFNFKFIARNESETRLIDQIVKTFRKASLPTYNTDVISSTTSSSGSATDAVPFFGYPNVCEIRFKWGHGDNRWLPRMKRAALVDVDVEYGSQGQYIGFAASEGAPLEVSLSTKWQEIELVTAGDINTSPGSQSY
jgi:hypothetical protein